MARNLAKVIVRHGYRFSPNVSSLWRMISLSAPVSPDLAMALSRSSMRGTTLLRMFSSTFCLGSSMVLP